MSYRYLQLAVVLAFCGQHSVYANGFGQPCGGFDNVAGKCDAGLTCTYVNGTEGTTPGACCRKPFLLSDILVRSINIRPIKICYELVSNPCSQQWECAKKFGEACGGSGSINGVCEAHLYCWEPQESSDDISVDGLGILVGPRNATCWDLNIAT